MLLYLLAQISVPLAGALRSPVLTYYCIVFLSCCLSCAFQRQLVRLMTQVTVESALEMLQREFPAPQHEQEAWTMQRTDSRDEENVWCGDARWHILKTLLKHR